MHFFHTHVFHMWPLWVTQVLLIICLKASSTADRGTWHVIAQVFFESLLLLPIHSFQRGHPSYNFHTSTWGLSKWLQEKCKHLNDLCQLPAPEFSQVITSYLLRLLSSTWIQYMKVFTCSICHSCSSTPSISSPCMQLTETWTLHSFSQV